MAEPLRRCPVCDGVYPLSAFKPTGKGRPRYACNKCTEKHNRLQRKIDRYRHDCGEYEPLVRSGERSTEKKQMEDIGKDIGDWFMIKETGRTRWIRK